MMHLVVIAINEMLKPMRIINSLYCLTKVMQSGKLLEAFSNGFSYPYPPPFLPGVVRSRGVRRSTWMLNRGGLSSGPGRAPRADTLGVRTSCSTWSVV